MEWNGFLSGAPTMVGFIYGAMLCKEEGKKCGIFSYKNHFNISVRGGKAPTLENTGLFRQPQIIANIVIV